MKSVLISINPKWCELIASGKKTIELRKTAPKLETPFKCHIYCSLLNPKTDWDWQYKPHLFSKSGQLKWIDGAFNSTFGWELAHQKVIGEFVCDRIYKLHHCIHGVYSLDLNEQNVQENLTTCLTVGEVYEYGKGKPLYGWHISDLKIYDKPKELGEFRKPCSSAPDAKCYPDNCERCPWNAITRPPQSWYYVEQL